MATKAKFKGDGSEFLNHIPAQDISEEEWELLSAEQKELVRKSPLYEYVPEKRASREGGD